jgi:hypothetical protein
MVRSPSPAPAAGSAAFSIAPSPSDAPSRPQGVGLTALALGVFLAIDFLRSLLHLADGSLPAPLGIQPLLLCLARGIALLFLWHYWKGRDWARVFVLLWSFLVAAQAIAFLVDHNLDPAALMGRPLSFFQALLAGFLLYWLNTPAPRAWFKNISASAADFIAARLVGKLCTALDFHPADFHSPALPPGALPPAGLWRFSFEHDAELTLQCPWRIVLDDNLAFATAPEAGSPALSVPPASTNNAPRNPVPDPSNDPEQARRLLQNLRVTAVRLAPYTSDLFLTFEMGLELQTWSPAPAAGSAALPVSPAPPWTYSDPVLTVVADAAGLSPRRIASPAPPAEQAANH